MRKNLFLAALVMSCGTAVAQENVGQVIDLLPDGVEMVVGTERKMDKEKNVTVAGDPIKGYKAFFCAKDATHGEELWVTDGTKEGTKMVKDIIEGTGSSTPTYISRFNDKVVFSAVSPDGSGREPWISDGTEEGTYQLADCYMVGDGDPRFFMQVNEKQVVFGAVDDESAEYDPDNGAQWWVWVTDGTTEGTQRISDKVKIDVNPKETTNQNYKYARVGRKVFFRGDNPDGQFGTELCVSDGTEEGTFIVKDINYEENQDATAKGLEGYTRDSAIDQMENYNNKRCMFKAWAPNTGNEWYASDGTEEGTYLVWDSKPAVVDGIGEGGDCFGPSREVIFGRIWSRVATNDIGDELAGYTTEPDDYVIFDINDIEPTANNNAYVDPGCEFQGNYFFCAAHGFDGAKLETNWGGELWIYDGKEKPRMQMNFCPGTLCDWVKELTVAGGSLYWYNEANDNPTEYGSGLYRLDESSESPIVCPQITSTGDFVHTLRNLGGQILYCSATTNRLYLFDYHKTGWDGKSDMGLLEPIYDGVTDKTDPAYVDPYQKALTAIQTVDTNKTADKVNVYDAQGVQVRQNVAADKATEGLQKGVYVVGSKKVVVR